jgi:hypothetical protein
MPCRTKKSSTCLHLMMHIFMVHGVDPVVEEAVNRAVGEVVDPNSMARTTLNNFTKPWGPFVCDIVAREVMPTWERIWDDFVQEETRLVAEASGQQQQSSQGDEDLALWKKGKKKTG